MEDYCIIGGGLSGLHTCLTLSKKYPKKHITLLQASDRFGGRIANDTMKNGDIVNMGAGRIAGHHPNTMKLLKSLKLDKDLIPITHSTISVEPLQQFESEEAAIHFLQRIVSTMLNKLDHKELSKYTFVNICKKYFGSKIRKIIEALYVTGYDTELYIGNAWSIAHTIQDMFHPNNAYFALKGGMERIIQSILSQLEKRKNVTLISNSPVFGWKRSETKEHTWSVYYNQKGNGKDNQNTQKLYTKHLHIAVGLNAWKQWLASNTIQNYPELIPDYVRHITEIPLCRVYASYDKPEWIKAITKCVTHTPLRYIIPLGMDTIMMGYLDGKQAQEVGTMDNTQIRKWIIDSTKELFPGFSRFIPEPTEIKVAYWRAGVHVWKPISNSIPPESIETGYDTLTIGGEVFSQKYQGWIEGALEFTPLKN